MYHVRSRSTAHSHSPRRLSTFGGRSRSNTTTSTASSRRSPASSMTSSDSSSLGQFHSVAARTRTEKHESVTKSLLSRGSRILRRQGSRFAVSTTLDEEDETDRGNKSSRTAKLRRSNEQLKRLISDPFDFHHLTHTSPAQFNSLSREVDLVSEFSALRASQKPKPELKEIRAEDLHFRNFSSSENLANYVSSSTAEGPLSNEPATPGASPEPLTSVSPTFPLSRARSDSRVFENFSRPISRHPRSSSTTPPLAPSPNLTSSPDLSEPAPRAVDEILGLHAPKTYPEHVYSTAEEAEKISASMAQITLEGIFQLNGARARAASSTNTLTSDLEDVPEEEVSCWRDSPKLRARLPACNLSLQLDQHQQPAVVPSSPISSQEPRFPPCIANEQSAKLPHALSSPTLPQYYLFQDRPSNDQFEPARGDSPIGKIDMYEDISDSWDKDIDFCYEHAAESNCNFDWFRTADEPEQAAVAMPIATSARDEPNKALANDTETKGGFQLSQEIMQPAILPVTHLGDNSPVRKCSSEESLILSRAASIVRRHRSSVSANSVPDLVHSSTSSREGTAMESPASEMYAPMQIQAAPPELSSHHRQTKSLVPEIETSAILGNNRARSVALLTHDRARSASEGATQIINRSIETNVSQPRATRPQTSKGAGRRKGRVSYSLFPSSSTSLAT